MSDPLVTQLHQAIGATHAVVRELAGGGMSRVFLVRESALRRDAVVKVLPPELVSDEGTARFRREIEVTARLHHPHILPVLTAGADGHLLYYFTPFVPGESLRERLRGPPLAAEEAIRLTAELLDAVGFAHAQGVVHRDIKPGNVLLSDGHAILADFGIARAMDAADDGRAPSGSSLAGAAAYRAPERSRGAGADLFSVGVMAHEMLLGTPGVAGQAPDRIAAALQARHRSLGASQAAALAATISRALDPLPERRPPDAAAMRQAILRAARPAAASRRYVALATAAAVLALAATTALLPVRNRDEARRPTTPGDSAIRAGAQSGAAQLAAAPVAAPVAAPLAEPRDPVEYVLDSARTARRDGRISDAIRLFDAAAAARPADPHVALQVALLSAWSGDPARREALRAAAVRALEARNRLSPGDAALAEAVAALGADRYDDACAQFDRARTLGASAFDSWFGLGECRALDDLVLAADGSRPVRFRTSYWSAAQAYLAAVRAARPEAPTFAYRRFDRVLFVQANRVRRGRGADGSVWFARPEVDGDSIAFRPFDPRQRRPPPEAREAARALGAAGAFLRPIYVDWARAVPGRPDPHEALADLLESEGTVRAPGADGLTALDENARALATADPEDRVRLTRDRVRLLVRAGVFPAAGRLADSVVAANPDPPADDAIRLVGPAALSGRLGAAKRMLEQLSARPDRAVRLADGRVADLPPAVLVERADFVIRAAAGACDDRLKAAPSRIAGMLAAYSPAGAQPGMGQALFERPVGTALGCLGIASAVLAPGAITPPLRAAQALARGDTTQALALLGAMDRQRAGMPGVPTTPELLAAEVAVRLALGDSASARTIIAQTLDLLPVAPATFFEQEASAATLVRLMAQLAELAQAQGDRLQAAHWAGVVAALWAHSDADLAPVVERMRPIATAGR